MAGKKLTIRLGYREGTGQFHTGSKSFSMKSDVPLDVLAEWLRGSIVSINALYAGKSRGK